MPSSFRRATLSLLSLSLGLVAAGAYAAPQSSATDSTADSTASQQQLTEQYIKTAFTNMDANHDGKIDESEFHAFMVKYLAKQEAAFERDFTAADTNHDGKLSRAEVRKANPLVAKYFDQTDTNHDGFLSKDEIRAAIRADQAKVTLDGDDDDSAPAGASSTK